MRKPLTALAAVFVFTACDGNPLVGTTGTTPPTATPGTTDVPAALAKNLTGLTYDAASGTLTVAITGLDSTPAEVPFARNLAAEAGLPPGYQAFSIQEDALDRFFVGIARQSADGTVRGGIAGDGGQFNRHFNGGHFERDGGFDAPDATGSGPGTGQVSYAGGYVGLDNYSGPTFALPPGADPALQMQGPGRIEGDIFLNANFADLQVNGAVFNRVRLDNPALAPALADLVLIIAPITDAGTFEGDVELPTAVGQSIGTYGGIFGGVDAASVAGVLDIENYDPALDGENEIGLFVLTQCGRPGEDVTLCAGTAP